MRSNSPVPRDSPEKEESRDTDKSESPLNSIKTYDQLERKKKRQKKQMREREKDLPCYRDREKVIQKDH